jgi:hypothetical protein
VGASAPLVTLGQVEITAPAEGLSPYRLPIEHWLSMPVTDAGLRILGYSGPEADSAILAGDEVALTLFLQNSASQPPARELYVALIDRQGNGVAGRQDWPLPGYPTTSWAEGALSQIPVQFYLPADLAEGGYSLVSGFVDPATGNKSASATLNDVRIIRRPAFFSAPAMQLEVKPPAEFGTHTTLVGYDLTHEGTTLHLNLTWKVLQPLLPPHQIFVHLYDADGELIAQEDGEPVTAAGRAPTGSWLSGEYVMTQHTLTLPTNAQAPFTLQTGLYLVSTGQRLPVTVDGTAIGDHLSIALPTTP